MKVIIDTNVLISAAWRDRKPEAVILWIVSRKDWDWIVSDEILREYREVMRREKFLLSEETLAKWDNLLDKLTTLTEVDIKLNFPRDQKDSMFLACALAAEADYLITGDRDFNEARKMVNTIILSVSQFKKLFIDTE